MIQLGHVPLFIQCFWATTAPNQTKEALKSNDMKDTNQTQEKKEGIKSLAGNGLWSNLATGLAVDIDYDGQLSQITNHNWSGSVFVQSIS